MASLEIFALKETLISQLEWCGTKMRELSDQIAVESNQLKNSMLQLQALQDNIFTLKNSPVISINEFSEIQFELVFMQDHTNKTKLKLESIQAQSDAILENIVFIEKKLASVTKECDSFGTVLQFKKRAQND
jgi:predicted oxidoreductase